MMIHASPGRSAGRRAAAWLAALATALAAGCGSGGDDAPAAAPAATDFRSVSVLAGAVDAGGLGDADGPAAQARFQGPSGVAVASDGAVWISETDRGRIRRVDASGMVETVVADLGALAAGTDAAGRPLKFSHPGPMAAGRAGEVYVAVEQTAPGASGRNGSAAIVEAPWAVLRIGSDRQVTTVLRPHDAGRVATAVLVDPAGRLLVADTRCAIWRALPGAPAAEVQLLHALAGSAQRPACAGFDAINSLAFDPQGRLVFSVGVGDIRRLEADGRVSTLAKDLVPGFGCFGMAYDRRGRLLINSGRHQLHVLDAQGLQAWAGSAEPGWADGPSAEARFTRPCGLALEAGGDAAVLVDQSTHTLRRIDADGRATTLAGRAVQDGFRDGEGSAARFGESFALGAARDGSLVAADPRNRVVRRIETAGRVSTLAGRPGRLQPMAGEDGPVLQARLGFPQAALVAGDGSLWIADREGPRRLGADGVQRLVARFLDWGVEGLALDANGDVLVMGYASIAAADGKTVEGDLWRWPAAAAPGTAPTALPLSWPNALRTGPRGTRALCAGGDGGLFFVEGSTVLRRAVDGRVTLWAGSVTETGGADGVGEAARFTLPSGLACHADGVYVADSGNHTVRFIDAARRVTTVLGRAGVASIPDGSVPGLLDHPSSLALLPGGIAVKTGLGIVVARH